MKLSDLNFEHFFDFSGALGQHSKCGLTIRKVKEQYIVIVTELYHDNPGTSITSVTASLAMQICRKFAIPHTQLVYIECAPSMNSKLSFYDEAYFKVNFEITENQLANPTYTPLSNEEKNNWIP